MKLPGGILTISIPVWFLILFGRMFDELELVDVRFVGLGFVASRFFNRFFASVTNLPFGYCFR